MAFWKFFLIKCRWYVYHFGHQGRVANSVRGQKKTNRVGSIIICKLMRRASITAEFRGRKKQKVEKLRPQNNHTPSALLSVWFEFLLTLRRRARNRSRARRPRGISSRNPTYPSTKEKRYCEIEELQKFYICKMLESSFRYSPLLRVIFLGNHDIKNKKKTSVYFQLD